MEKWFLAAGLFFSSAAWASDDGNTPSITVIQNGVKQAFTQGLDHPAEITLDKGYFVINAGFVPDDVAIQICATTNPKLIANIAEKPLNDSNNCFEGGTGLAVATPDNIIDGMSLMVVETAGHNYFSSDRRETSNSKVKIYISNIDFLENTAGQPSWLAVFIAQNDNNIAEQNELWSAKVSWR